jgi:cytochrome c-type biogenesis protein CcmH/NrfF
MILNDLTRRGTLSRVKLAGVKLAGVKLAGVKRVGAGLRRALLLIAFCTLGLSIVGAGSDASSRFSHIGHQLVCQCGCGQILLECNHVGCPVSGPMIDELRVQMAASHEDRNVLNWFVTKYGAIVLAAPIRGGFDNVAWIVPLLLIPLAIVAVVLLVRVWHKRRTVLVAAGSLEAHLLHESHDDALAARIRRETDYDAWQHDEEKRP